MQSPQVRATDGQKASLRLGDKYPYATGSFAPGYGATGGGVSPLVSTQFSFADVGVNVDVTPRIHGAEEVSMQIELEISAIKERINVGGLEQPVIGQRKVSHIIRVREGEATMIGGLMMQTERLTRSGVPGLMNLPWIGKWLSSDKIENTDADLLVVLVPHIVRAPEILPENLRGVATGTETIWKVNYQSKQIQQPPPQQPAGVPVNVNKPPIPSVAQPPAGQAAANFPPVPAEVPSGPPPAPPAEPAPTAAAPGLAPGIPALTRPGAGPEGAEAGQPRVLFVASNPQPALNSLVTVNINVESVKDLFAAPMKVSYDGKILKLVDVKRGAFMAQDGQQVTFEKTTLDDQGSAIIALNRVAGAGGVSGSGTLVSLLFQAVGQGSTKVTLSELTMRDAKLQTISMDIPAVAVTVK
jgi:general secretion pathway protein D